MKDPIKNESLKELIKNFPTGKVEDSDYIVVTRIDDFDPKSNEEWSLDASKSYSRDLMCVECNYHVVMSNGAFADYNRAIVKPKVLCGRCMFNVIGKQIKK